MKKCTKCGEAKPANTKYFNMLPSGNYRGTCKVCMAANTKKHYDINPEKVLTRVNKYKIQKNNAEGQCSSIEAQVLRNEQKDNCSYCGDKLFGKGELDHKVPVSRGGSNWPSNMTWACTTCNRDKHNKTVEEFAVWRKKREVYLQNYIH